MCEMSLDNKLLKHIILIGYRFAFPANYYGSFVIIDNASIANRNNLFNNDSHFCFLKEKQQQKTSTPHSLYV